MSVYFNSDSQYSSMCHPEIISQEIGRIGHRSFDRRMRMASPMFTEKRGEMTRLLNEADSLCNQLHEAFQTISPEDYAIFGPRLRIVIATLKALMQESQNQSSFTCYEERMKRQISDLEELEHDIKVFRVDAQKNESLKKAMKNVGQLDFSKLARV